MRMAGGLESIPVILQTHRMKTVRHPFRVAVFAPGADFRTAGHRIPG